MCRERCASSEPRRLAAQDASHERCCMCQPRHSHAAGADVDVSQADVNRAAAPRCLGWPRRVGSCRWRARRWRLAALRLAAYAAAATTSCPGTQQLQAVPRALHSAQICRRADSAGTAEWSASVHRRTTEAPTCSPAGCSAVGLPAAPSSRPVGRAAARITTVRPPTAPWTVNMMDAVRGRFR